MTNDTIKLLRECDSGVQMGVASIEDVVDKVKNDDFRSLLNSCKCEHERLRDEVQNALLQYGDDGKDPNPMAKGMSKMRTGLMTAIDGSDETVADLMTDGCNMGVKSLGRYLTQYPKADEQSKAFAGRLIGLEENLAVQMRQYL